MKSLRLMPYRILRTLFLCVALLLVNISCTDELKDLTVEDNQGDADAQYNLGTMYDKGEGVPQDDQQAYVWYSLAAANGHSDAPKGRDEAASKLSPQQLAEAQEQAKALFNK